MRLYGLYLMVAIAEVGIIAFFIEKGVDIVWGKEKILFVTQILYHSFQLLSVGNQMKGFVGVIQILGWSMCHNSLWQDNKQSICNWCGFKTASLPWWRSQMWNKNPLRQ